MLYRKSQPKWVEYFKKEEKMNKNVYILLNGEEIDLEIFDVFQIESLRKIEKIAAHRSKEIIYFEINRIAEKMGLISVPMGISKSSIRSARYLMYRIVQDIAYKMGIKQGVVLSPKYEHLRYQAPRDGANVSQMKAAEMIGISWSNLRKLIKKKELGIFVLGNMILINKYSLTQYIKKIAKKNK